jgi:hypothetical protein
MTDNWELAVGEARGEFLQVLGDDDGLMPWALREIESLLTRFATRVVRWEAAFYTWPDIDLSESGDYLRLSLGRRVTWHDAPEVMAAVLRFEAPYSLLPTLYHAVVHRDLVDELRRRAGRVLGSVCPDVYSGFALAFVAGRYPSVGVPMTMAGLSARSTGVANVFQRHRSPIDADYRRLNAEAGIRYHAVVPDLPIFPEAFVADSFLHAKAALFPDAATPALDRRRLLTHCIAAIRPGHKPEEEALRATVGDDPALAEWLDSTLASGVIEKRPDIRLRPGRLGFDGESLHLDTARFGVKGVRDAVSLAERILHYRGAPIEYVT